MRSPDIRRVVRALAAAVVVCASLASCSRSNVETATSESAPPSSAPTLTLGASPASVASGGSATLSWSSSNTVACIASGAWSGPKGTSGTQSTGALTSDSTFTLTCAGAGGISTTQSVTVAIATPPGNLSFQRVVVDKGSVTDPWMKSLGDLDGDGLPDLIVAGASGPVVWYQAPLWTRRVISATGGSESGSAVADVDGDGDLDVVVGKTWYENVGNASSWVARPLPNSTAGTHDIVIADVDGDGKPDIVMRGETASVVSVYLQVNKTTWKVFDVEPGVGRNGLDVADLNGDGRRDIVVGGVWMENPGGDVSTAAWPKHTFAAWNDFAAVRVVDIDRDLRPDIVLSVSEDIGKLSWFKAPADPRNGTWVENAIDTGLDHVHNFEVFDVDKDGFLDVTASEYRGAGRLIVYRGNGGASWQPKELGRDFLHNLRAGDLDNDGDIDFFGANAFGVNPVIVYRNTAVLASRVLVFSKTLGFRHASIPDGIKAIQQLGTANAFTVDATEDSSLFTPANLERYKAVVFLNPSGDVLDPGQRAAFQSYIENGGGFAGVHNATALVLEDWDWYTKLVGARYVSEISTQPSRLQIVNTTHISTQGLPNPWNVTVETYNWNVNPKVNGATVLINLDETSVSGGTMGADHPWSWFHAYDGGRSWYTVGGANTPDYQDANFLKHLLGGIRYAGAF